MDPNPPSLSASDMEPQGSSKSPKLDGLLPSKGAQFLAAQDRAASVPPTEFVDSLQPHRQHCDPPLSTRDLLPASTANIHHPKPILSLPDVSNLTPSIETYHKCEPSEDDVPLSSAPQRGKPFLGAVSQGSLRGLSMSLCDLGSSNCFPSGPPISTNSLDAYQLKAVIGCGSFSRVREAIHKRSKMCYAVKLVELQSSSQVRAIAENEIRIFTALQSKSIPRGKKHHILWCYQVAHIDHEACGFPTTIAMVLDYCEGGELFDLIATRHADLTMIDVHSIMQQILKGLSFVHAAGIAHRDLKLENVLLATKARPFSIKLSDFGLSTILNDNESSADKITTRCGSEEYAAPEVIMGTAHDPRSADVWSTGVIFYALLCGFLPFTEEPRDVIIEEIVSVPQQKQSADHGVESLAPALARHQQKRPSVNGLVRQLEEKLKSSSIKDSTKIVRRRSTRRAGRKGFLHRICRAEFSFPDSSIEVPSSEAASESIPHGTWPLLTSATKALVLTILDPNATRRPKVGDLLAHPWVTQSDPSCIEITE